MRRLEVVRREGEPEQRDEAIGSDGGDGARANEAGEGDLAGKDRAKERGRKDEDDCHGVLGLAVRSHPADPVGQGKDAVSSYSVHQARCGDDGDAGVLGSMA